MSVPAAPARRTALIEPIDPALLSAPLDFMLADHYRQRAVLTLLDTLCRVRARGDVRRRVARTVLDFLRVDLAHHIEDEQRDLFPLLRRRVARDSTLIGIVDQLQAEHASDRRVIAALAAMLDDVVAHPSAEIGVRFRIAAAAFVHAQRRHLAWVDAIMIPLLRAHVRPADLRELARRMAARRGLRTTRGSRARPVAGRT